MERLTFTPCTSSPAPPSPSLWNRARTELELPSKQNRASSTSRRTAPPQTSRRTAPPGRATWS